MFYTENDWPSCGYNDCDLSPVPGTTCVIPLQKGIPSKIMKAFAGVINEYVESLDNDSGYNDEGGWTATNSVATSNHLGETAMDLNWNDHPMGPQVPDPAAGWQWSAIVGGPVEPRVREVLDSFPYKGIQLIWWGNDWDNPHDSMHFQMGYNTYQNQNICQEYIDKFINPDGSSKFMQDKFASLPDAAKVLAAATGIDTVYAAQILPQIQDGLIRSECNTVNRIAMWLAQMSQESAKFTATVEVGTLDGTTFQGRTWIQITGSENYSNFSKWAFQNGISGVTSATYFLDNPEALGDPQYAAIGPAWYWTVARPQINSLCDNGDIVGVTKAINGGTNGLDVRTANWNLALKQGTNLLKLLDGGGTVAPDPNATAVITQTEWDSLVADIKEIRAQLSGDWPQNSNDMDAAKALDELKASGARLTPNDILCWIKNHTSTHKDPRP